MTGPGNGRYGERSQPTTADIVDELFAEFYTELSKPTVVRVVRRCQRELAIVGTFAPNELRTRARGRLRALAALKRANTGRTI